MDFRWHFSSDGFSTTSIVTCSSSPLLMLKMITRKTITLTNSIAHEVFDCRVHVSDFSLSIIYSFYDQRSPKSGEKGNQPRPRVPRRSVRIPSTEALDNLKRPLIWLVQLALHEIFPPQRKFYYHISYCPFRSLNHTWYLVKTEK